MSSGSNPKQRHHCGTPGRLRLVRRPNRPKGHTCTLVQAGEEERGCDEGNEGMNGTVDGTAAITTKAQCYSRLLTMFIHKNPWILFMVVHGVPRPLKERLIWFCSLRSRTSWVFGRTKKLLGAPGIATRSKDARNGSRLVKLRATSSWPLCEEKRSMRAEAGASLRQNDLPGASLCVAETIRRTVSRLFVARIKDFVARQHV